MVGHLKVSLLAQCLSAAVFMLACEFFCMILVLFGERKRKFFFEFKGSPFWRKLLEGHFEERLSRDFPEMF